MALFTGFHRRQVDVSGFDGTDITISHNHMYFTSQRSKAIRVADLTTGQITDMVTNVTKPGRLYVHREQSVDEGTVPAPTLQMEPHVMVYEVVLSGPRIRILVPSSC